MTKLLRYFIITGIILSLSACDIAPLKKRDGSSAGSDQQNQYSTDGDSTGKYSSGAELSVESLNDPNSPLSQRIIYFDLDSSQVKENDRNIITTHAEFLVAHPDISIVLEGHADERGSREYNIALGEKRAKAVKQLMTLQGVADSQIQVISFGEERPVALGHDESAWSLNRRVEILYTGY